MELSFNVWNRRERSGTRGWVGFHIGILWNNRGTHIVRIQTNETKLPKKGWEAIGGFPAWLPLRWRAKPSTRRRRQVCVPRTRSKTSKNHEAGSWIRLDVDVVVVFQHGSRISLAGQKGSEAVGRWDEGSMTDLMICVSENHLEMGFFGCTLITGISSNHWTT